MSPRLLGFLIVGGLACWLAIVCALLVVATTHAYDGCRPEPVTSNTPTGIAGCVVYGEGTASRWSGPGVARNDCVWPWTHCTPIVITSLETGRSIIVTPTMFCDCYTGTADERIVDLDPTAVAALGLDPAKGLYAVNVEPATIVGPTPTCDPACQLPDTAVTLP